jgi:hypothetical protein
MSTIRADATKKPLDYVRQLRVGGHDVVEDQWRAETDAVTTTLLNNQASLNPGLVVTEAVALSGDPASITVGKAIATLLGVVAFEADGVVDPAVGTTAATADGDQVANPGLIALTGTTPDGWMVVYYTAA